MRTGITIGLLTLGVAAVAGAVPTSINDIPTADVVRFGQVVLQGYTTIGSDPAISAGVGVNGGVLPGLELGVDDRIAGKPAGTPVGQIKFRFLRNDKRVSAAVGAYNLGDSKHNGAPGFYIAAKRRLIPHLRGHLGFRNRGSQNALYLGADGDILRGWDWRADVAQANHMHDATISLGVAGPIWKGLRAEVWATIPTQADAKPSGSLRLGWAFGRK